MENLFDKKNREDILERLSKIKNNTEPKWGKMNSHQMIVHLSEPLRVALGDITVPLIESEYSNPPFNIQVSQTLPWPNNAPTIPEFDQFEKRMEIKDFDSDLNTLLELIDRFSKLEDGDPIPTHPLFGYLTNEEWARTLWRHIDHHLNQFGL
ncbi:MAG: DUF1569 domain-containing protein [Ignavibacteriae bacterium]|nr:DUF1569 domain-containing protein [Ignavibacteriota bacterium]